MLGQSERQPSPSCSPETNVHTYRVRPTPLSPSVRQHFVSPKCVSWLFQLHHKVWPFPWSFKLLSMGQHCLQRIFWKPRTCTGKFNHRAEKLCKPQRNKIPLTPCFSSFWISPRKISSSLMQPLSCCHNTFYKCRVWCSPLPPNPKYFPYWFCSTQPLG